MNPHSDEILFIQRGTGVALLGARQGSVGPGSTGEHRVRRPPPGTVTTLRTPYIIKIDGKNGGSSDFFMGYENITPGDGIAPHHHPFADEILFIHRGSGVATVGPREGAVNPGTTIYIPRDTRATLRNTGAEKMTIAFIFARPGIEQYFRDTSVAEGQPARPFSPGEFAAVRKRHREHVTFDGP